MTCDCGAAALVTVRRALDLPRLRRTWDTSQIPGPSTTRLLEERAPLPAADVGPPLALAAVLVPLAVFVGIQFAFLLFVLVMAYALLVVPQA